MRVTRRQYVSPWCVMISPLNHFRRELLAATQRGAAVRAYRFMSKLSITLRGSPGMIWSSPLVVA